MKKHLLFKSLLLLCALVVGTNAWASDALTTSDFTLPTPQFSENFNSLSTTSATATINNSSQTAYGVFNKMYNNNTSNSYAIASNGTFGSNVLSLSAGSSSPVIASITGQTFGTKGAFSVKMLKTDKSMVGLYAADESNAYAKAKSSVYLQNTVGALSIGSGDGWVSIGTYSTNIIEVLVIYNNTNENATYGDDISLGSKKAHVYVNGTCVMNGSNPKDFTIPGTNLTAFRVLPQATNGNKATIDDVKIYNSLPTGTPTHSLTYSATNGSIAGVDAGSNAVLTGASIDEGATVTLTATPSTGYTFSGWSVSGTGSTLSSTSTNPTIFTMGTADATVTATFEALVGDYITPSPTLVNVGSNGDIAEFEMSTNVSTPSYALAFYTTSTGDVATTKPSWLGDCEFNGNTLDIEVEENTTAIERSTYFKVYSGSTYSPIITITQDALVVTAPSFSTSAGAVAPGTKITLTQAAADEIRYTLDGTDPTKTTGTVYSTPIEITTPTTIKAIAVKGDVVSDVATAAYTIVIPPVVTLDFTTNGWDLPTSGTNTLTTSYTSSGYTITIAAPNNYYFDTSNLFIGKSGATLTLPAFGFNVDKIKVYGTEGSSKDVTFNVFVGDDAVSTQATSSKVDHEFAIASEKQDAGTIYTIKVTNAYNMRITKIEIYGNGCEAGLVQSYGWATYIPTANVEYPANTAYIVTAASVSSGLTLEEVTEVPTGTPILLKGAGAKTAIALDAAPSVNLSSNLLSVSNGLALSAGSYPYVLAKNGEGACFKQWTGAMSSLNGRVMLVLDEVAAARAMFDLDENDVTAIEAVKTKNVENGQFFNLAGQRVANPTKGLYIVNGKKVVIK